MNFKFNLHDKVKLPEEIHKDLIGTIVAIYISDKGIQYLIRYFWECKSNEVYFYEWELKKYDN